MPKETSLLMLQFLAWVADRPRAHADVMEAWRSTCPRMTVWEDAVIDGLVRLESGGQRMVVLTPHGRALMTPESAQQLLLSCGFWPNYPCIRAARRYIPVVR
jgi:hypothetical protein